MAKKSRVYTTYDDRATSNTYEGHKNKDDAFYFYGNATDGTVDTINGFESGRDKIAFTASAKVLSTTYDSTTNTTTIIYDDIVEDVSPRIIVPGYVDPTTDYLWA